jgi:excisionase family DNA binding protein
MSVDCASTAEHLLTVSLVARLLRQPQRSVRYFVSRSLLPATRASSQWKISRSDLNRFIAHACAECGVNARPLSPTVLMTVSEVATNLGRSKRTIRLSAQRKRLPGFRIGRAWRFWRVDIDGMAARSKPQDLSVLADSFLQRP